MTEQDKMAEEWMKERGFTPIGSRFLGMDDGSVTIYRGTDGAGHAVRCMIMQRGNEVVGPTEVTNRERKRIKFLMFRIKTENRKKKERR